MYKTSKYNYILKSQEKFIYFNGMKGTVFAMSDKEHEKMDQLFNNLYSFEENYKSVFEKFVKWGFIVPDDMNEIDQLRFNNKTAVFSDKFYRLIINPTTDCIFSCWYCDQHSQNKGGMPENIKDKLLKHISYMVNVDKITGLHLDWFGGEPLMYFDEIVVPISKYGMEITDQNNLPFVNQITTNGFLIDEDMVKKLKDIKIHAYQITIDGDEKRHNKIRNANGAPTFKKIFENINLILSHIPEARITLRLNYDDSTLRISDFSNVFNLIAEPYRMRVFPNFQRVWQTIRKKEDKNNDDLMALCNTVENLGYKAIMTSSFNIGSPIKCYGDRLYNTVVDFDGKIYKCTARTNREAGVMDDNGIITWNQDTLTRLYAKPPFENQKCLACKHLPICLNSCVQNHSGSDLTPDKCMLDYSEVSVEEFIISLIRTQRPVEQ